jgi:STE24 endopeptidase
MPDRSLATVNESKSSRFHRSRRRAAAAEALGGIALLVGFMMSGASIRVRDFAGGSVSVYVVILAALCGAVTLPPIWYRTHRLERMYELSKVTFGAWLRDYLKAATLTLALAVAAAEFVYAAIRLWPQAWWIVSASAGTAMAGALTLFAPVWILPLFHRIRPLTREDLSRRLHELSAAAGVSVLGVHEWALGDSTTRAHAALVGAGATRRILVSDTLLADYTDDEIEVVLAHEIGHHVHRDVVKGLVIEFLLLAASFWVAAVALRGWAASAQRTPSDVAGLPVVLLAGGAVCLLASPLLNELSRRNEREADRFALNLTQRPAAFIATVRRMAAQNLAEEHPSRSAYLLFHTHPTVEQRIESARTVGIPNPLSLIPNLESESSIRILNPNRIDTNGIADEGSEIRIGDTGAG